MANKTLTLVQAARQMEEGGTKIKIGNFDTFEDFLSYFRAHYKPLLERLADEWAMATDVRRFFTDDMLSAFGEDSPTPGPSPKGEGGLDDDNLSYSSTMRKAVAYVMEQMEPEDIAIIVAKVDKNFKQHTNPAYGIDEDEIIDLLEEYGEDHDLDEGWWMEECEMDDIVLLIAYES